MFKRILYIIFVGFILSACKTQDLTTTDLNKKVPAKYAAGIDTAAAPLMKWREVFFDPALTALIDSALIKNYDLRITLQKIEMSRAGLKFTRGIRLPELGLNVAAGQRKFGEYTMDGVGNYDTQFSPNINSKQQIPNPLPDYYVGFQASWEIDLWGKLKNKKRSAASKFIASQYGKDLIVTNLIAEVASTYFELLAFDNALDILNDNILLQQSALDLVNAQKDVGKANALAVEMLSAQLLASKSTHAEMRQELVECESKLNFLCGAYPETIKRDTNYYSAKVLATINAGVPSALLVNRPDIRQSEMELAAGNADVRSAKAAFYPSLNITAAMGLQSFNAMLLLETPASAAYSLFGGLAAPLLNRRKLKADLMASKAEQRQAFINYEKTVVNSFKEVYVAVNNIKNTKEMLDFKNEEVTILKQSVNTSADLFKAGRANYLEIITAQKNALQSQLELTNYYKRQNLALVDLYRSLGGGWK